MRRTAAGLVLLLAVLPLAACDRDAPPEPLGADAPLPSLPPVPYAVRFTGELPPAVADLLPRVSEARRGTETPPTSRLAVRQRAEADLPRLLQALRSEGYYDGKVDFRLDEPEAAPPQGIVGGIEQIAERPQVVLVFEVTPGPRYLFDVVRVELADNPDRYPVPEPARLGLAAGEPARAQVVLDAEAAMLAAARAAGFALARLGEREAVVDHATRRMEVTLRLLPGRRARFGEVAFTGAEGIDEGFLRGRLPFAPGEVYAPEPLGEGQRNLFDTDLFSTILVRPAERLTPEGRLDVAYDLRQRPPRSVGAELGYQTDEGVRTRLFWEHRNFFGAGERLRADLATSLLQQQAGLSLSKPDFLRQRQSLLADVSFRREIVEAYDSLSAGAGIGLERELSRTLKVSAGVAYRYARIQDEAKDEDEPEEIYGLASLPLGLSWNFADDVLNPTTGGTLALAAVPFWDTLGPSRRFLKSRLTHTRYLKLAQEPQVVLALRGSLGAIVGVARDEVPADERFYAGGGGSVRGIGFQLAGPLDEDDDPLGGRSLIEGSIELRARLWNDLGGVLFLDAGTVGTGSLPGLDEELLFGAGPGLRYYTPIGPIRVDLGFPLNPRQGVDDAFQLYVSIGQAF